MSKVKYVKKEIDENNAIRLYLLDYEGNEFVSILQDVQPEGGAPWESREQAQAWMDAFVAETETPDEVEIIEPEEITK
jgi:hypothetical protein